VNWTELWKTIGVMLDTSAGLNLLGFAVALGSAWWAFVAHRSRRSLAAYYVVTILLTAPTVWFLVLALFGISPESFLSHVGAFGLLVMAAGVFLGVPALGWLAGLLIGRAVNTLTPQRENTNASRD
jgi:hypothetical protein